MQFHIFIKKIQKLIQFSILREKKKFFFFTEPVNINPTPVHDPASTDPHTSDSSQPNNDHPGETIWQILLNVLVFLKKKIKSYSICYFEKLFLNVGVFFWLVTPAGSTNQIFPKDKLSKVLNSYQLDELWHTLSIFKF